MMTAMSAEDDETWTLAKLRELLDAKTSELEAHAATNDKLRDENRSLESRIKSTESGWSLPRHEDHDPKLPSPRLEIEFIPYVRSDGTETWETHDAEFRLVYTRVGGVSKVVPLNRTTHYGGDDLLPWHGVSMPSAEAHAIKLVNSLYRMSAEAWHDAIHLGLPLYVYGPGAPTRVDPMKSGHIGAITQAELHVAHHLGEQGHGAD